MVIGKTWDHGTQVDTQTLLFLHQELKEFQVNQVSLVIQFMKEYFDLLLLQPYIRLLLIYKLQ